MKRIPYSSRRRDLWRKIMHDVEVQPTSCWIWQKGTSGKGRGGGYGRVYFEGQMIAVHRAVYIIVHGYIHKKQQVDHTCGYRICCNPEHLEAVSQSENLRRIKKREGSVQCLSKK